MTDQRRTPMNEEKLIEEVALVIVHNTIRSWEGEILLQAKPLDLAKQIHELYKKYTHLKGYEQALSGVIKEE